MKIEILHDRDPDGECSIRVFVDGVPLPFDVEDVDPGRGYTIEDWRESTHWITANAVYTDAFKAAALAAREDAEDSHYIVGEREAE